MPALAILSQLKLIHYALLGAIIFGLGMLAYTKVLKMQLSLSQSQHRAFVADTKAVASEQIAKNLKETVKRDEITRNLEKQNAQLQINVADKYASYRLRNSNAGRRPMPTVSISPECRANGQEQAIAAGTVAGIETRLLEILEQGDKGISAAITHEDWVSQQSNLK